MSFADQLREKNPNSAISLFEKKAQEQIFHEKVLREFDGLLAKVIKTLKECTSKVAQNGGNSFGGYFAIEYSYDESRNIFVSDPMVNPESPIALVLLNRMGTSKLSNDVCVISARRHGSEITQAINPVSAISEDYQVSSQELQYFIDRLKYELNAMGFTKYTVAAENSHYRIREVRHGFLCNSIKYHKVPATFLKIEVSW